MHKKIKKELDNLAHSILRLKNDENIEVLHKNAQDIYEKLTVLKFVNQNLNSSDSKEHQFEEDVIISPEEESVAVDTAEALTQGKITENEKNDANSDKSDKKIIDDEEKQPAVNFSLEEEFNEAISSNIATDLFGNEMKTEEKENEPKPLENEKRSLNDSFLAGNLQVGLNDRIAFVKHLFNGSQEDFNRVLSQLNSFKNEKEAKQFIIEFVKPDYDWIEKEEFEERLISLIERKFA